MFSDNIMQIIKIDEPQKKSEVCEHVLRSLPLWFGIESAIIEYIKGVRTMSTWVAYSHDSIAGFVSINKHFTTSAEVHVMGVLEKYHRQDIGCALLEVAERELRKDGTKFLTVKTLSESRPNKEYDQTRKFYLNMGFSPLEEFKTLWGEHNPCLFLAKAL